MRHWILIGAAAAVALAFQAGRSFAENQMAPQIGYHAQGERQAAVPLPIMRDDKPSTDMALFLQKQSKAHGTLAWSQEQMRNDLEFLKWLGSAEKVRLWQTQSDHVMQEAAHLRDDYASLASWVAKEKAVRNAQ